MPITTNPIATQITVTQQQSATATNVWGDGITIDASARDLTKVSATVKATPYTADGSGNPTAFGPPLALNTKNLLAACQRIPSLQAAFTAVEQGIADWTNYYLARQADVATAQGKLATARAAQAANVAALQATVNATFATRTSVYATRSGTTDPAWVAADQAWTAANTALAAAQSAGAPLFDAVTAAQVVATNAQTAIDPANPPVKL